MASPSMPLHVFDPAGDLLIVERRLPHWSQAGTICFITWRTDDSVPEEVLHRWRAERCSWLRKHGIDPDQPDWRQSLRRRSRTDQIEFYRTFSDCWHDALDACHGECVLRRPELAKLVGDSLRYFDGDRYELTDFVVMPNHVHLLAAFPDEQSMLAQCESWKHFTATQIHRRLGRRGRFWQQDGFDRLVRSAEHFDYLRRYIAENPARGKLGPEEVLHYSKRLTPQPPSP